MLLFLSVYDQHDVWDVLQWDSNLTTQTRPHFPWWKHYILCDIVKAKQKLPLLEVAIQIVLCFNPCHIISSWHNNFLLMIHLFYSKVCKLDVYNINKKYHKFIKIFLKKRNSYKHSQHLEVNLESGIRHLVF